MADMVADKELDIVADMEVDKVADMMVDMVADMVADMEVNMVADINIEIQYGERVGHRVWLIGPKLFRPKAYPACASSKLCELIPFPGNCCAETIGRSRWQKQRLDRSQRVKDG